MGESNEERETPRRSKNIYPYGESYYFDGHYIPRWIDFRRTIQRQVPLAYFCCFCSLLGAPPLGDEKARKESGALVLWIINDFANKQDFELRGSY